MIIACDVDGVVADLMPVWLRLYNADWGDTLTPADIISWDVHLYVKRKCGHRVYDYLERHDLYDAVVPIAGARDGVAELRAAGHRVVFVSTCTYGMTDPKARWLRRHGLITGGDSGTLPEDFIVARDKALIAADMLIDDGLHNLTNWWTVRRRPSIVMNAAHNLAHYQSGMLRAGDWAGIVQHVQYIDRLIQQYNPSL